MAYDFKPLRAKVKESEQWLQKEYQGIRTSRATPALLDSVKVDSYGSLMALNTLATISIEDSRTLRVSPWDPTQVKNIEKAIVAANLGVSVATDEKGSRVSFPELTTERRESLLKLAHERLEQAKKSLRGERDKVWHDIQAKEKKGEVSEDDKFRFKDEMEKIITEGNKVLEALSKKKEEEIKS